jgi:hypothetical protein
MSDLDQRPLHNDSISSRKPISRVLILALILLSFALIWACQHYLVPRIGFLIFSLLTHW